jgi:hypothetical protein
MIDNKPKADYAPNEKKVWRPKSATQFTPDAKSGLPAGNYFIAIEELQGAWVDGVWEEAESSESWTETDYYTDNQGIEHKIVKEFTKDIPRSCRYVLKRFTDTGFAENAFSTGYAGPRKYQKN